MSKILKCPYCNRTLYAPERYCWFCEQDVSKVRNEAEKPRCFIATAVFGENSYEVKVLRDFRDDVLCKNVFGKIFVQGYYKISPAVARAVEHSKLLKRIFRAMIRIFIKIFRR